MSKIIEIINFLATVAPPVYQESYDNATLLVGDANADCTGVMVCLDALEEVIEEAHAQGCNLVVAHHPILFKGITSLTGKNYVERVLLKAIRYEMAIYAIHTNLDNVLVQGVNERIAQRLGLQELRILQPKLSAKKLTMRCATDAAAQQLKSALQPLLGEQWLSPQFFSTVGILQPPGGAHALLQLECYVPPHLQVAVQALLDSVAYAPLLLDWYWQTTEKNIPAIGAGVIGKLAAPMSAPDFLAHLKARMEVTCIRHTALSEKPIQQVALCGGAGSFLLPAAKRARADVFVTADYKYHEFFDADRQLLIADIGHYESEQFTIALLFELLSNKFSTFAVHFTTVTTNPIQYYY